MADRKTKMRRIPKLRLQVSLTCSAIPGRTWEGFIYDFALSGLELFMKEALPHGELVEMTFDAKTVKGKISGTVLWSRDVPSKKRILSETFAPYQVGIEFTAKTVEEKKLLADLDRVL